MKYPWNPSWSNAQRCDACGKRLPKSGHWQVLPWGLSLHERCLARFRQQIRADDRGALQLIEMVHRHLARLPALSDTARPPTQAIGRAPYKIAPGIGTPSTLSRQRPDMLAFNRSAAWRLRAVPVDPAEAKDIVTRAYDLLNYGHEFGDDARYGRHGFHAGNPYPGQWESEEDDQHSNENGDDSIGRHGRGGGAESDQDDPGDDPDDYDDDLPF